MIKCRLQEWIDESEGELNYTRLAALASVPVEAVRSLAKNQAVRVDLKTWQSIARSLNKPAMEMFYEEGDRND